MVRKNMEMSVIEEAVTMKGTSHVKIGDIVRKTKVTHGIVIHKTNLTKSLDKERDRIKPHNHDAMDFIWNLMGFKNDTEGMLFYLKKTGVDERLCNAIWSFTEWLESYYRCGVVRGVCVDAK